MPFNYYDAYYFDDNTKYSTIFGFEFNKAIHQVLLFFSHNALTNRLKIRLLVGCFLYKLSLRFLWPETYEPYIFDPKETYLKY